MNFSPIIVMAQEVRGKQSLNELHKGQGWSTQSMILYSYLDGIGGIFLTKS